MESNFAAIKTDPCTRFGGVRSAGKCRFLWLLSAWGCATAGIGKTFSLCPFRTRPRALPQTKELKSNGLAPEAGLREKGMVTRNVHRASPAWWGET